MKRYKNWIILGVITMMIWSFFHFVEMNLTTVTYQPFPHGLAEGDLQLVETIKREAKAQYIKPVNAKIDPVWKAIPGYNGRTVNIEKTYYFAKKLKGNIPFVYDEIEPEVSLEELGPQPIYKGNPNKPMTSIMINVAWGNEFLPSILETLAQENIYATFFLDGTWLKNNVEIAKDMQLQGHELANHAYSHKNMSQLSWNAAKDEILKTQQLLKQHLNIDNELFAPPSGDYDEETVKLAHELNLKTILWTIDTLDWKNPDPIWIVKKISARIEPGSMILMHPTHSSSTALPMMIKEIKSKGLAIGKISDIISSSRILEVETRFDF
jgi:probable sporulation protein (polysaccharide deacetylase family)